VRGFAKIVLVFCQPLSDGETIGGNVGEGKEGRRAKELWYGGAAAAAAAATTTVACTRPPLGTGGNFIFLMHAALFSAFLLLLFFLFLFSLQNTVRWGRGLGESNGGKCSNVVYA